MGSAFLIVLGFVYLGALFEARRDLGKEPAPVRPKKISRRVFIAVIFRNDAGKPEAHVYRWAREV